ncbi:MAG: FtsX-like permease family protein, partial [Thermoguttaceae bacterium]|nr:FtsX-like permease family protein [Thermoguttaceae bacterium]
ADVDQDGFLSEKEQNDLLPDTSQFQNAGGERGTNGSDGRFGGGRGTDVVIPQTLITEIQRDPSVILCDQTATVRAFVYSPGMPQITPFLTDKEKGTEPGLQQTPTDRETLRESGKTISDVPDGIDPKLHHSGMAAYRAVMGLPMGMGSMITGTTAQYPPYELKEGKWLRQDKNVPEAVLTKQSAKQLNARPGDNLLIITGTAEYQLEIVGQVDDPLTQGLYVSMPFAKKIAGTPPGINSLNLKLRISAEEFREQWEGKVREISPNIQFITEKEIATQKQEETKQEKNLFLYQAISGTMLAVLASVFIIFTTLNISVREQKRQIAFYRTIGLTRWQVSLSILTESLILAIPGWFGGIITGLFILNISTGTMMTLNYRMTVFSFISVVFGAILAALYPMFRSDLVKPLDAVNDSTDSPVTFQNPNRRRILLGTCELLGILFLSSDVYFVHTLPMDMKKKALLHSSIGIFMLALGVLFLIPILIRLTELVFVPLFARIFRFTPNLLRTELSGNIRRTTAVTAVLSIGGGLFVSMQIWGYSMLGPFLPGHGMPERFVAFLPIGLKSEYIDELKNLPGVKANEFLPIALEQAA